MRAVDPLRPDRLVASLTRRVALLRGDLSRGRGDSAERHHTCSSDSRRSPRGGSHGSACPSAEPPRVLHRAHDALLARGVSQGSRDIEPDAKAVWPQ